MRENPLISVIIPIYKVEKYIQKCVSSIMNQTYQNLEIILVDDGSPDHSGNICDELAKKDNRIQVIHKENDGVSNARNTGMHVAKGDYIYFIDGDDYAESNALEVMLTYAINKNADLIIADINIVDENGNKISETSGGENDFNVYLPEEAADTFMELDWGPWNKLYSRNVHINVEFPSHKIHEDEAIMLQLIANSHKIIYTHEKLYNYVKREESTTTSTYSVKKMDWLDAWVGNVEFAREIFPQSKDKAVAKMLVTAIYNLGNLLKIDNEKDKKLVEKSILIVKRYFKEILINQYITFNYKFRAILLVVNFRMYKKLYRNRG